LRVSFPKHRIVVAGDDYATVLADRNRVAQVVTNLVANAAKFSPPGSEIRVDVHALDDDVVTSVQDFGIGIPVERQCDIFDRYCQAHRGTPYEGLGGLGLGLYVSKEIVTEHGGRIWFESASGKGTTFRFSLPRSNA